MHVTSEICLPCCVRYKYTTDAGGCDTQLEMHSATLYKTGRNFGEPPKGDVLVT